MKFTFQIPTKVYFEKNCITNHLEIFTYCGSRAAIVTGKHSAKASGALDDVTGVLKNAGIAYEVYDSVENNPSIETVEEITEKVKAFQANFIIGIGGGSPIDASKAVAVLAANEMHAADLFKNDFTKALPIVAIPITSGTGSEVTPYSVLLRKDMETKVSFGTSLTYPAYALLDPGYTVSMNDKTTVSTLIDAFTHVMEGYLANRSTIFSTMMSLEGIKNFAECIPGLKSKKYDYSFREKAAYVSLLGGLVIAQTGVTLPHGLGYCYTYFHQIPHGIANGLFVREYLKRCETTVKEKVDMILELLGEDSVDSFGDTLEQLIGKPPKLDQEQIEQYAGLSLLQAGSISNTPFELSEEDIAQVWEKQNDHAE